MKWRGVLVIALLAGCHKASDEQIAAYQAALTAATGRITAAQTAFAKAVTELEAGKWVARADLGPCAAKLPPIPGPKQPMHEYLGWSTDTDSGRGGWDALPERVFKEPGYAVVPRTDFSDADDVTADTQRLVAFDPTPWDIMILRVDEVHPAAHASGTETFTPGSERGRGWVWSASKKTIVCAATFHSTTPHEVDVKHDDATHRDLDDTSALMIAMREASTRQLAASWVAAGPPQ